MISKSINIILFLFLLSINLFSQANSDSLVLFSELRFHSKFEQKAFQDFIKNNKSDFNLFLAINKDMTEEKAKQYAQFYELISSEVLNNKVRKADLPKQIKLLYSEIHRNYLTQYREIAFFPEILHNGTYNCVTSAILFSLLFDQLKVSYKIMVSPQHVYLVADPEDMSIVVETANPNLGKSLITGDFKKQYTKYLKDLKIVSAEELLSESEDEIFASYFSKVKEARFYNLPGLQYYNMAVISLQSNDIETAYENVEKAYFLFPEPNCEILFHHILLKQFEKSLNNGTVDLDYLVQLSRFNNSDLMIVPSAFHHILEYNLQFTDKEPYCDSIYQNLILRIENQKIKDEISFIYYAMYSNLYRTSDKLEYFSYNALKIKPNHREALKSFEYAIERKYEQIHNNQELLDTIQQLRQRYELEAVKKMFDEYEIIATLGMAYDNYKKKKPEAGEEYLQKFENSLTLPVNNRELLIRIVDAYRVKAEYYSDKNKAKEKEALEMGLKYVPNSSILKVLMETKGYKPK